MKIAISSISYNEEKHVERFCKSAKDADIISIADTGSTDKTVDLAKKFGATVNNICISPWRFDHARNAALALLPKDIDVVISLDLDEVMAEGWREEIERVWKPETTRLGYYFDWGCGIKFRYEKIFSRHGYYFWHPCHEYPRPDARITEIWAETPKTLVTHLPDATKSRGQYLDLLALSVKEDPSCPRNAFYYARELSFHFKWQESIDALNKYLGMEGAIWPNERCYAMRVMGRCYEGLGDFGKAEHWYMRASAEAPDTREPWVALADLYYRQERWLECLTASMRALGIKDRDLVYTCDPEVWGSKPHDLASISAWKMGFNEVAIDQCEKAIQLSPDDDRLKNNLENFRIKVRDNVQ